MTEHSVGGQEKYLKFLRGAAFSQHFKNGCILSLYRYI